MSEAAARRWDDPVGDEDHAVAPPPARPRLVDVSAAPRPEGRRTITITGQAAPPRRRPARRPHERVGARPDRMALWAVVMCLFLILVAAMSANAAVPVRSTHVAPGVTAASAVPALGR